MAKDVQDAIKEMVTFNLMPATTLALRFTGNSFPGIANPQILSAEAMFWSLGEAKMKQLLDDLSLQTAVEAGDGHFPAVVPHRREGRLSTPAQLAAIFDETIMPAALQQSTRNSYFCQLEGGAFVGNSTRRGQVAASDESRYAQGFYSGASHGRMFGWIHTEYLVRH